MKLKYAILTVLCICATTYTTDAKDTMLIYPKTQEVTITRETDRSVVEDLVNTTVKADTDTNTGHKASDILTGPLLDNTKLNSSKAVEMSTKAEANVETAVEADETSALNPMRKIDGEATHELKGTIAEDDAIHALRVSNQPRTSSNNTIANKTDNAKVEIADKKQKKEKKKKLTKKEIKEQYKDAVKRKNDKSLSKEERQAASKEAKELKKQMNKKNKDSRLERKAKKTAKNVVKSGAKTVVKAALFKGLLP